MAFQRKKPAAMGVKAPLPGFIEPALASSIEKVPSGQRWIHEIKLDGYRVQVHLANERAKIFTRRGHDWTHRFKKVAHDAWRIKANSAVMDGEIVVPADSDRCRPGFRDDLAHHSDLKSPTRSEMMSPTIPG
ncbi:bifunctional non-homologous end joining protein LigD [Bradyrhizobium sp. Ghvi]|uniref:ATP-dependent DNA ligase n=1 Tax=Bradyrhizobium sp. Ghvi TaxID=1855319 RepID=UPI0008F43BDB|nr:hypothetical protein [Bradyrhizobium sp. Ghvi]SFP20305.1 bifunctional non-homologous end joining protein LigD [Bradyrhizobium sp. Ghvi]